MDRNRRVAVEWAVHFNHANQQVSALTQDISEHGLFVQTNRFFLQGASVDLTLSSAGLAPFRLRGRVAHVLPVALAGSLGRRPGMGIELLDELPSELAAEIEEQRRLHGARDDALAARTQVAVLHELGPMRARVAHALSSVGFLVTECADRQQLQTATPAAGIDLLLVSLDIALRDGWQLLGELGQDDRLSHAQVVVVPELVDEMTRLDAFRHGVDEFLHAPFTDEELCLRMQRLLRHGVKSHQGASLRGRLAPGVLNGVLSLLDFERESGRLLLLHRDEHLRLALRDGRIVQAQGAAGERAGEALRHALRLSAGTFEFSPCNVDVADEFDLPMGQLLLEHACHEDELRRDQQGASG